MTQKELLYVEDAIGHEQNVGQIVAETISLIQDKNLKSFLKSELKKHQAIETKLLNLLESEVHEWQAFNGKYFITT